jgi:hypothetical protein
MITLLNFRVFSIVYMYDEEVVASSCWLMDGRCEEFLHTFHMKIRIHKTHLGMELLCSCILTS